MKLIAPIAVMIAAATAGRVYDNQLQSKFLNSAESHQSADNNRQRRQYSVQSEGYGKQYIHNNYQEEPSKDKTAEILGFHVENNGHSYKYGYETDNGIKAEEVGETTGHGTTAQGAYSYKGDDGKVYTVTYIADEHGFRPSGDHLPTPPPIPEEILKSLEMNAHAEANGVFDDGSYHEHKEEAAQEFQGGQHYESGQQAVAVSGADLAYHAHTPSYHAASQVSSEHGSTGYAHSNLAYYGPSGFNEGHSGSGQQIGHVIASAGHGQQAYEGNLHASFLPAAENSGYSYGGNTGHVADRSYLPPASHSGYHK